MCALRLKQARGCTIQPLPLRGTGDSEKAPDVPKGTEQITGGGIWILAFSLSIRKITVEMWGFFLATLCRWVNSGLQRLSSVPPVVLCLPWAPEETVPGLTQLSGGPGAVE